LNVDIIICQENNKNISHIIEYESNTGGTTIVGKSILINASIKKMIDEVRQIDKPKVIFLYKPNTSINLDKIRYDLEQIAYYFTDIDVPFIEYYTDDWDKHL
jgi:hypothetical protein